jgi:hypothetical protein
MWSFRRLISWLFAAPVAPPPLTRSIIFSTSPAPQFASWLMPQDEWPRASESTRRETMKLTLIEGTEAPPERQEARQVLPGIPATLDFTGTAETPTTWRDKLAQVEHEIAHCRAQELQQFLLRRRPWQRRP